RSLVSGSEPYSCTTPDVFLHRLQSDNINARHRYRQKAAVRIGFAAKPRGVLSEHGRFTGHCLRHKSAVPCAP
ncbi:MAG: hypothetical protein VXY76_07815, partial [Pseudomonadota bacterium]|nr:hypothetical protein [Pseudomonadota bacterium]